MSLLQNHESLAKPPSDITLHRWSSTTSSPNPKSPQDSVPSTNDSYANIAFVDGTSSALVEASAFDNANASALKEHSAM